MDSPKILHQNFHPCILILFSFLPLGQKGCVGEAGEPGTPGIKGDPGGHPGDRGEPGDPGELPQLWNIHRK